MLVGTMNALVVGDLLGSSTHVGPVIDRADQECWLGHVDQMTQGVIHLMTAPPAGRFVQPTVITHDRPEDLTEEWFGPILHVVRWDGQYIVGPVRRLNASGYELDMGVRSRMAVVLKAVRRTGRVGNLYVNRLRNGAVVSSRPFGGKDLSGTGPNAGGPFWLQRYAIELEMSIVTSGSAGNARLLSVGG